MTDHHPPSEYLLEYAAGVLPQGAALVVAGHLTFCPACRKAVAQAEAIGGALLRETASQPVTAAPVATEDGLGAVPASAQADLATDVPAPLRPVIGTHLSDIRWRTFWPGMSQRRLVLADDPSNASLLRLAPGKGLAIHTHGGDELTLVLQGSYTDETGRYQVGDVAYADDSLTHYPVADPGQTCICLTVVDTPLKFRGWRARFAARFLVR